MSEKNNLERCPLKGAAEVYDTEQGRHTEFSSKLHCHSTPCPWPQMCQLVSAASWKQNSTCAPGDPCAGTWTLTTRAFRLTQSRRPRTPKRRPPTTRPLARWRPRWAARLLRLARTPDDAVRGSSQEREHQEDSAKKQRHRAGQRPAAATGALARDSALVLLADDELVAVAGEPLLRGVGVGRAANIDCVGSLVHPAVDGEWRF